MTSTEVATTSGYDFGGAGLDDVDGSDLSLPRLKILGPEAEFKNALTNESAPKIYCVILGLVKQRILWHPEVEDDSQPQCKSNNFELGFPTMGENVPARYRFPFEDSNYTAKNLQTDPESGRDVLACKSCSMKDWGSDRKPPRCGELHVYPMMFSFDGPEVNEMQPAVLTLQRSALAASKSYISYFAQKQEPFFTVLTEMTLTPKSRGSVRYATPNFKRVGVTEADEWSSFMAQYKSIREFLRRAPRDPDAEADDDETTPAEPPKPTANAPAESAPAGRTRAATATKSSEATPVARAAKTAPAPVADDDDEDDLPF